MNEPGPLVGRGRSAEVFAWGENQVLKLFLDGFAGDAEREMLAIRVAREAGLPAPDVGNVVETGGRRGIVMERVDGPSMLAAVASRPWSLVRMGRMLAELHAQMHSCDAEGLPSHRERIEGKVRDKARLRPPVRDAVLRVLRQLPDGTVLYHGDFHPDNVMMSGRGPVIIDWVDASHGNPLADVARTWFLFRKASMPVKMSTVERRLAGVVRARMCSVYLRRYRQLRPFQQRELVAWRVPVAAARLAEAIPEETEPVVAFIETSLRRLGYL